MLKCSKGHTAVTNAAFCHACGESFDQSQRLIAQMKADAADDGKIIVIRTAAKKVLARLSRKAHKRIKGMAKSGQGFLDDVSISSRTFPDKESHSSVLEIASFISKFIDVLNTLSKDVEPEAVNVLEKAVEQIKDIGESGGEPAGEGSPQEWDSVDLYEQSQGPNQVEIEQPSEESQPQF